MHAAAFRGNGNKATSPWLIPTVWRVIRSQGIAQPADLVDRNTCSLAINTKVGTLPTVCRRYHRNFRLSRPWSPTKKVLLMQSWQPQSGVFYKPLKARRLRGIVRAASGKPLLPRPTGSEPLLKVIWN